MMTDAEVVRVLAERLGWKPFAVTCDGEVLTWLPPYGQIVEADFLHSRDALEPIWPTLNKNEQAWLMVKLSEVWHAIVFEQITSKTPVHVDFGLWLVTSLPTPDLARAVAAAISESKLSPGQ